MKIKVLYGVIIGLSLIVLYLVFGMGKYEGVDKSQIDASYQKGIEAGLDLIIRQAKNPNCDTIDVMRDEEQIRLINIECLKK